MNEECGCCEGIEKLTPIANSNRPGLSALSYRVGTHGSFLETMKAALSSLALEIPVEELDEQGKPKAPKKINPLTNLQTRVSDDPAIALLDAWATVADVLTFYQERIANEGYLQTATEQRSILELARMVGYRLRPGVAASVYLAFTLEKDYKIDLPVSTRAQSVPGQGELPQSFETAEKLEARAEWNNLQPKLNRPQEITRKDQENEIKTDTLYFQGTATNLKPNDPLLFIVFEVDEQGNRLETVIQKDIYFVKEVKLQAANNRTKVELQETLTRPKRNENTDSNDRAVNLAFAEVEFYALRVTAPLFGHNAPKIAFDEDGKPLLPSQWKEWEVAVGANEPTPEAQNVIFLDNVYNQIVLGSDSYIAVHNPNEAKPIFISGIESVSSQSRSTYGISTRITKITLPSNTPWWNPGTSPDNFSVIRGTTVYAQSEKLELAEEPIEDPIDSNRIELEDSYPDLKGGRWLIVSGDLNNSSGKSSELVMLASVEQKEDSNKKRYSTIILTNNSLTKRYKRDTVTIYGNVVKATHGETREEILGSGDGSKALQQFTLRQAPLTYLAATTPNGTESTLQVRVNDILWHETENLAALEPSDRRYITQTDDESKTTIVFGNGEQGSRLPTGVENVKATYRTGIGKAGNVEAEKISQLATRPLGLKSVINPLLASGGADRESHNLARRNASLGVLALGRLVSLQDYTDFTRAFAGIGKASAIRLWDRQGQFIHLTIAGADDIPIDPTSELDRNLRQALHQFGDPNQRIQVEMRELKFLCISAKVRVLPEYQWKSVEPKIRSALLDVFSFNRRDLGQDVFLSEVINTIQQVAGVAYVDVDTFSIIPEKLPDANGQQQLVETGSLTRQIVVNYASFGNGDIQPAQLAYLNPTLPETLLLTELSS
ncbi:putative baseplate assembly protein [Gloeocapsopsis dulcis]|uniref:Putative baseplate assembly protein n=1 Tax=Gloeocapsopsis dulcis AAB1 = 1H9 TaxID=1433147 RepID=A0A6N8FQM9_9CHRO|nr:putative baseplate assembly protein [Gloeocapsopsis dulcis]MUL34952.1 putative baseplate assembly protein [Gloeocapsopsis dulcis AAB1 = 1H9]WNN89977.1 putative baseplate assembly protein [Gloeocapsopsis dulcis]